VVSIGDTDEGVNMSKRTKGATEAVQAMRLRHREEIVAALRDGRKQRAWRIPNGRAAASKRACRGRHDG
jgi:hypothetical protein